MTDRESSGLLERCHRNYVEAFWVYTRWVAGARRGRLDPPAAGDLLQNDFGSSASNLLFLHRAGPDVPHALAQAGRFFGPGRAWRLISMAGPGPTIGAAAASVGLRPVRGDPGLVLERIPRAGTGPSGLSIQTVDTESSLQEFGRAWSASFGMPSAVIRLIFPRPPPEDPTGATRTRLYVGVADGLPVACSSVVVTEGVAGIVSVGTIPSARGRGFGRAITAAAVEGGRALGADSAFLAATRMGYPMYEKMGFQRLAEYPTWEVPMGPLYQLGLVYRLWRLSRASRRAA